MTDEQIKDWLSTIDPMQDWNIDDIDELEEQVVRNVKECGYLNLRKLLGR